VKGQEWYQADSVAQEYDDKRFSGGGRLIDRREKAAVLEAVEPAADNRVLEIACGTGRFTVMLAERGVDIVGLDISGPMLQQGREKARAANVSESLEFLRGDAARLPFPDDHFDVVLAMRFFHLAEDPAAFMTELRRVSRNRVVFDTFNSFSTRTIYNWALPMGSRLYTRSDVTGLIEGAGLDLIDVQHDFVVPYGLYRGLPNGLAQPIRDLDTTLSGLPGGHRLASVSYWTAAVPDT
jgi:SAM-dependent methyltransferase